MFLSDLKENQSAVIVFSEGESVFGRRLCDLGFCEGEKVLCVKRALFGSPVLYRVKESNAALRTADAKRIEVVL